MVECAFLVIIFALYLMLFFSKLMRIENKIDKGNKDQQEIKTRLHWVHEDVNLLKKKLKIKK